MDFGLSPAQSHDMIFKDTQITELRSVPKSPYLASPNRRKLFILKDPVEFFSFFVYVLKKGALVFSTYRQVDALFVSACYSVLPLLFNISWVLVLWHFYNSVFWRCGKAGKKDRGIQAGTTVSIFLWALSLTSCMSNSETLFSFCALYH